MRIEHFALNVREPAAMSAWYGEHCGFTIKRKLNNEADAHFIADETGQVILEVYNNSAAVIPDYASMNPLELHLAFQVEDVEGTLERLLAAGASVVDAPFTTPGGDRMTMLRDPWGLAIQFIKRAESML